MVIRSHSTFPVNSNTSINNTAGEDEFGERSGLWGNDHPWSGGRGDSDIPESDSSRSGQHDLHQYHGQGRNETEETALGVRRFVTAVVGIVDWRSWMPSFDSSRYDLPASQSQPIASPDVQVPRLQPSSEIHNQIDHSIATVSMHPSPYTRSVDSSPDSRSRQPSSSRRSRQRSSPFCPCFSPTVSDDSDSDSGIGNSPVIRDDWAVSDQLRQRLAIAGEAASQLPFVHHTVDGDAPVHRIVEYSHHLVPDVDKIYAASYYWGVMDRFKAEELLEGKQEGTFLLRDSAQSEYLFSVSFRRYQRTLHARIEQGGHRFGFDIHDPSVFSASTVTALIENYKDPTRCLFFEPQLTHPLHRNSVFSLQELARAVVISSTTYPRVAQLRLPTKLKQSVREYHYSIPVRTAINVHD